MEGIDIACDWIHLEGVTEYYEDDANSSSSIYGHISLSYDIHLMRSLRHRLEPDWMTDHILNLNENHDVFSSSITCQTIFHIEHI